MTKDISNSPDRLYPGRILHGDFSSEIKKKVAQSISLFREFDSLALPIMPYIAAWNADENLIWYEFVSHRLLKLLHCGPSHVAEIFRKSILDRRVYEDRDILFNIEEKVIPGGQLSDHRQGLRQETVCSGTVEAVYKVRTPGAKAIWLKDVAKVVTFVADKACISLGCLTDVSMEMDQKEQINQLNVVMNRDKCLLVEAERHDALGQMSAQVFHEIRNPVSAIGGLSKRLLKKNPPENMRTYLEIISKEAQRLEHILQDLFDFNNPVELQPEATDPLSLVKETLGLLKSELDQYSVTVTQNSSEDIPAILIDSRQLRKALVYIIKNAMEATPDHHGKLEVSLSIEGRFLVIEIRDFGMGIRQVHEKRVTEPFFTTKVYGSGLGLSLAKKAVELHGGSLEIVPRGTQGTSVFIRLPASGVNSVS